MKLDGERGLVGVDGAPFREAADGDVGTAMGVTVAVRGAAPVRRLGLTADVPLVVSSTDSV